MTPVLQTAVGLAIPFVGTALGAAAVFLFKSNIPPRVQKILLGFASGVMLAASVWSLLLPALELSGSWLPVVVGFLVGIGFLLGLDQLTARLHLEPKPGTAGANSFLLVLAVTLHNVPEGMAVGVAFAGMLAGDGAITPADAFALAVGIALQNIPEGTIVAAPLRSDGCSRSRSFVYGVLSGYAVRCRRAGGRGADHIADCPAASGAAVFVSFCCRCYGVCGAGGVEPPGPNRSPRPHRHHGRCCRLCPDDDHGCGAGLSGPGDKKRSSAALCSGRFCFSLQFRTGFAPAFRQFFARWEWWPVRPVRFHAGRRAAGSRSRTWRQ